MIEDLGMIGNMVMRDWEGEGEGERSQEREEIKGKEDTHYCLQNLCLWSLKSHLLETQIAKSRQVPRYYGEREKEGREGRRKEEREGEGKEREGREVCMREKEEG
jgi:hypothetical protein